MERLLVKAIEIATKAHKGQTDKGGAPYILHPTAVAAGVEITEQKIVAYLHDVIEDTDITEEDLIAAGFPKYIIEAVKVITKSKGVSYQEYLQAVKNNELARAVKISDIRHNMDLSRIENPTQKDFDRVDKYRKALLFLEQ